MLMVSKRKKMPQHCWSVREKKNSRVSGEWKEQCPCFCGQRKEEQPGGWWPIKGKTL